MSSVKKKHLKKVRRHWQKKRRKMQRWQRNR